MLFIVFRRGQMNYANRADYILQRLDDYPRLQEHYLRETEELQTLWDDANLMSRAHRPPSFFRHDEKHPEEEEKLRYIADITWSSEARILSGDQKDAFWEESREKGLNAAFAPLEDGRILALSFPADDISLYLQNKEYSNLLVRAEQVLRERLAELPSRYPEIIGQPEYLGVIALPEQNAISQRIAGCKVRVRFRCLEKNRTRLSYLLHREMVQVTHILLNDESEAGLAGCQIVSDTPSPDRAP